MCGPVCQGPAEHRFPSSCFWFWALRSAMSSRTPAIPARLPRSTSTLKLCDYFVTHGECMLSLCPKNATLSP